MTHQMELTVLNDLCERLKAISAEHIEAAARHLKPRKKDETAIGELTSPATRAIYALWVSLTAQEKLCHARAELLTGPELEAESKHDEALYDMLGDAAREIFWAQAKIDLGFYEADCQCVGLRAGWQLVRMPHGGGLPSLSDIMRLGQPE